MRPYLGKQSWGCEREILAWPLCSLIVSVTTVAETVSTVSRLSGFEILR